MSRPVRTDRFLLFLVGYFSSTKRSNHTQVATESADFLPTQPINQKSPAHAAGTRPFSKKYRATAARAPLRDAISQAPQAALPYPPAAAPPNARAKPALKNTPPPAADLPDPREEPP